MIQRMNRQYGSTLCVLVSAVAAFAGLSSRGNAQITEGVRVISSDARSLVLEVTPEVVLDRQANGDIIPIIGSAVVVNHSHVGEPIQMTIPIPVAFPSATGNHVEVLSVVYDEPMAGRIAPVPTMRYQKRGDIPMPEYRADPAAYARPLVLPPVADVTYLGVARDVHSGTISVAPYEFNPLTNSVRFLRSIRLRLQYGAAPATAQGGVRGEPGAMTRLAFVNAPAAEQWGLPVLRQPAPSLRKRSGVSAARAWMRVEVKEDGLYELTSEDFNKAGIDLGMVDPSRIAIYGGDGGALPEQDLALDHETMHQIPAIVEQNGGRATRVLFYGAGPSVWRLRDTLRDTIPTHKINPYVTANSYIVAVDGEQTRSFQTGGTGEAHQITVTSAISRIFVEEEKFNAVDIRKQGGSGRDWFGTQFQADAGRQTDPRVFSNNLSGLDRNFPVFYRLRLANAAATTAGAGQASFKVEQGGSVLGTVSIESLGDNNIAYARTRDFFGRADDIQGENSLLKITYSNVSSGIGCLDWYEIHYGRYLRADGDRIFFDGPSSTSGDVAQFQVSNFTTGNLLGLDITDPANPVELRSQGGDGRFTFNDRLQPPGKARRYFISSRNAARRVAAVAKAKFGGLRERLLNAEVIVITHEDFREAAEQYVAHRNSRGMSAAYVTTEEIYTEFSSGNLDPTAIRNYMAYAFNTWSRRPTHLVLFGDGSYDYRNIMAQQKQFVPAYETDDGDEYNHITSSSYDDFFVRVTTDGLGRVDAQVDLAVGRLPVETIAQARDMVAKIVRYEDARNYGLWRQTIILAADDDFPLGDGGGFTRQSEGLWRSMPDWTESRKIYLAGYPTEQLAGRRKPGAEADLLQSIDGGAVITNWVGHGNPKVWAHETLLDKDKFIARLRNDSMLTYIPAVTCNFGYFDDPAEVSGGELFVLHQGGAIGVMTATRAVYIGPNEVLMRQHFKALFTRDSMTRRLPTVGQALVMTKYARGGADDRNDQKFLLLGDPALQLNLPRDSVKITRINSSSMDTATATVGALMQVTIEGEVLDQFGAARSDFNGTAIVSLYDADRTTKMESGEETVNVLYYGGRLFRGPANVANGRFSVTFRVPKDIAYDSSNGRVYAYAFNENGDAAGMTRNVIVYGADDSPVTDHSGPDIKLFLDDRSFRSGDLVTTEPLLIVDLSDPSGINSSGSSIGHRIEAWINGNPKSVDLTETYQTQPTDYSQGTAQRRLLELEPGEHHIRVRAWDIYNNVSENAAYFRIADVDEKQLKVVDVVNYPNPMARETDFLFRHNQTRPLDVDLDIFTSSGRKVRQLESRSVTDRFVKLHWDGTDSDGHQLANGVYLYRLRVRIVGDTEGREFETIEKVAIVR